MPSDPSKALHRLFGDNLRKLRHHRGMSQAELGRISGVSRSRICELENGEHPNVSLETADKLAAALGTTIPKLLIPNK